MKNNENMNPVYLNLEESSNAQVFEKTNLIHKREFERAKYLIEQRIKRTSKANIRYNDTISILGSRGSGKTSFLYSLISEYINHDKLEVLEIIDPTLIEQKGHIFLTIISLIKERVSKKIDEIECSTVQNNYHLRKEWEEHLLKLADGLPSIDGVGSNLEHSDWQDAEYIMNNGLNAVTSAKNLEENFNNLLQFALKVIGDGKKKAFVIILDDIDVEFKKGWPVLEIIRKYLTSPHLIVILSGDLKLYSKAIRKQQWLNFGKALLINENDRLNKSSEYNQLVTEMESQYMQKVLMPENRIELTTIYEKVKFYKEIIFIEGSQFNSIEIQEFYNKVLNLFGINNKYQAEAYSSFLLNLPIRTQIQFLKEYKELQLKESTRIVDAFLSDLYEKNVDIELARNLPKMLNVIILKLLLDNRILADAYQLQPTTTNSILNSNLISLSFLFSQKVKNNPHLIFDYIIKIGFIQNISTSIGYADKNQYINSIITSPSIEGLCMHSGIFQDKVLRDVVGKINSYLESIPNNVENTNGSIYLKGRAKKDKKSKIEKVGRIDYEFDADENETSILEQTLAFIPISTSKYLDKNESITTYSIYMLIGAIGELLRKDKLDDLENGLLELSQWRTYPMVSFEKNFSKLYDNEDYIDIGKDNDSEGTDNLINLIKKWHSKYYMNNTYSPHLIGKITTRIYYTFNNINQKNDIDINLGVAMHRRLIAFLNAVLIEDIRENCSSSQKLNISNAVSSDAVFLNNLDFANTLEKDKFNFSRWMLSCPLFLLYLDNKFLNNEKFTEFIFPKNQDDISVYDKYTVFNKLCKVHIKGQNTVIRSKKKYSSSDKPMFRSTSIESRVRVIGKLIENKIPITIFSSSIDKSEQERLNAIIRNLCSPLFQEEKLTSTHLRSFRKFLESDAAANLEIIKEWEQIQ